MLKGNVEFSGNLRVEGRVDGNIIARDESGTLFLGESSAVEGDICAPHVVVNGTVKGNIRSSWHVKLRPNSCVVGNEYYKGVEMQLGATIHSSLVCDTTSRHAEDEG